LANGECVHHSGFNARIDNVEKNVDTIMQKYSKLCDKIDNINANTNRILGGIVIACVLLVINLVN